MKTLRDLFLGELKDMHDAGHRIIKTLPKQAGAATCERLKAAFLATWKKSKDR
jgi:ferritin-like metal-binding protein YciE